MGQFLKAEHSFEFLPIYLETAVGKELKGVMHLLVPPEHLFIIVILPAEQLPQLVDSLIVPQDLYDIGLSPLPYPILLLEHGLAPIFTFVNTGLGRFQADGQGTYGGIGSIFHQFLHGLWVFGNGCDHQGSETQHITVVDPDIHILIAFVRHKSTNFFVVFADVLMELVHARVQRGRYTEYPQLKIFDHGIDCEGSEQQFVPDQLDDFPYSRPIDQIVRLRKEYLKEEDKILLIFDEDSLRQLLIVGQFGDEEFQGLDDIGVLIQNGGIGCFSKSKIIGGQQQCDFLLVILSRQHLFVGFLQHIFHYPQFLQKLLYFEGVLAALVDCAHAFVVELDVRGCPLDLLRLFVLYCLLFAGFVVGFGFFIEHGSGLGVHPNCLRAFLFIFGLVFFVLHE